MFFGAVAASDNEVGSGGVGFIDGRDQGFVVWAIGAEAVEIDKHTRREERWKLNGGVSDFRKH